MLSRILTQSFISHGMIAEEEREIYEYGFDITIYTIWSTAALLLLGLLLRQFIPAVILVFGFYTFQTCGGGYHAKSHFRCFLTMVIGLLTGLSTVFIMDHHILLWLLLGIGALLLLLVPLVLHPNKSYLEEESASRSNRGDALSTHMCRCLECFLEQNAVCIRYGVPSGGDIADRREDCI